MIHVRHLDTPLGPVALHGDAEALTALRWASGPDNSTPLLDEAARQLTAYFAGTLTRFDIPWRIDASPAQQAACRYMAAIPFGETRTYGDMAGALDVSPQAAGQLCGANPIAIIIPCHRILGRDTLGGFSAPGGIEDKVALLRHEGAAGLLI